MGEIPEREETIENDIQSTPMKGGLCLVKGEGEGQHFLEGEPSESGHSRDRHTSTHVLRAQLGSVNICRGCQLLSFHTTVKATN